MLQQCKASCSKFAAANDNILQDTSDSCVNVAQENDSPNTVCAGDKLRWDTTSSSACADTYDPNSQLAGSACLDAAGAVPNATCYRTPAAISEPGFRWPPLDLCYPVHREAALGRRASSVALALALAIVVIV